MDVVRYSTESYPKSSSIYNQHEILQRNLLTNSLNYRLKQHQALCTRQRELPRDLSTANSGQLSDENFEDLQDGLVGIKEVSVSSQSKCSMEPALKDNALLNVSRDSAALATLPEVSISDNSNRIRQESGLVRRNSHSKQENRFIDMQFNTNYVNFEDINNKVNVRKRNGIFEPVSKYVTSRKHKENHPLCARQPSGRKYKTFILTGETIREIKSSQEERSGDRRKLNSENAPHERNEFHHIDDEFAFRRPEYLPPKRDINSIGLTWTFPTIEPETTKQQQNKPIWSWLIAKDNCRDSVKAKADSSRLLHLHSSPGQEIKGTHSKDVHPVATAMNRQGINSSRVKWTVPTCGTGCVDATRFVMERLELVKRPTGLFYDGDSILQ